VRVVVLKGDSPGSVLGPAGWSAPTAGTLIPYLRWAGTNEIQRDLIANLRASAMPRQASR